MKKNIEANQKANPVIMDIEQITKLNDNFRRELWTGDNLQLTVMSLQPNEDIGLEVHNDVDQFIRIEQGVGLVTFSDNRNQPKYTANIFEDYAVLIPAGVWHNIVNIGEKPLKLYSIYAPPEHPRGTIHETKEDALLNHEH